VEVVQVISGCSVRVWVRKVQQGGQRGQAEWHFVFVYISVFPVSVVQYEELAVGYVYVSTVGLVRAVK